MEKQGLEPAQTKETSFSAMNEGGATAGCDGIGIVSMAL